MESTKRGRFRSAFWRSIGVFLLSVPLGTNAVEISNGIPAGTVGHFRVDVDDAGATRRAIVTAAPFASDGIDTRSVVRNYYSFVDPGNRRARIQASGSAPVPRPQQPEQRHEQRIFHSGSMGTSFLWTAVSSIAPERRS